MAGTTVDDVIDGMPLVLRSYDDAFQRHGVENPDGDLERHAWPRQEGGHKYARWGKGSAVYKDFVEMLQANIVG